MARWFLIPVLFLAVFTPAFGFLQILESLVSGVSNVFKDVVGAVEFIAQASKFSSQEVRDTTPKNREEYDFIVVGAGSAGAAIASRLSEITGWKILLIEAGGHETLLYDIPVVALYQLLINDINWNYYTEPSNEFCRGMKNRQCRTHKGKVLGGTSVINFMIAIRGNKHDYDEWAQYTGDESWSYNGMLPIFKKMEAFHNDIVDYDVNYHNYDGPVRITNPSYRSPLVKAFVKAGKEMGYPSVDYNGVTQTGFNYMQTNQINGERMSSNRAYLHPARKRKNLFVSINSHVNKVLIDPKTKTAYGVEFTKNGKKIEVIARKEVILSAGAIASPQLLMLSGVGPAEHLKSLGINVIQDSPVGENLIDHIAYGGLYFKVNQSVSIVVPETLDPTNPYVAEYLTKRTGPGTTAGSVEGLGYVNVDDPHDKTDRPNIELMFAITTLQSGELSHVPIDITGRYWTDYFEPDLYKHAFIIFPLIMKPKSRGKILLRSAHPTDKPKIFPNYLSHPDDVRVGIKGIRMAIEVSKTKAMQKFNSRFPNRVVPGCEKYVPDSDAYWECALRTYTITLWHHSGTCKMGKENDTLAVVNTRLQIKGIKNLRVADASIMPDIVTAHINVPTMAIGEKFAEILKHDYGYK